MVFTLVALASGRPPFWRYLLVVGQSSLAIEGVALKAGVPRSRIDPVAPPGPRSQIDVNT